MNSTEGTSAITHSSKPGSREQPGLGHQLAAAAQLARGAHEREHHVEVVVAGVPHARERLELEPEDVGLARVAQGPAVADHRVRLLRLEAIAAAQPAELVGAEVDRPVGDRTRREAGRERASAPSAMRATNSSPRPSSSSTRGWSPASASSTISSARSRPDAVDRPGP